MALWCFRCRHKIPRTKMATVRASNTEKMTAASFMLSNAEKTTKTTTQSFMKKQRNITFASYKKANYMSYFSKTSMNTAALSISALPEPRPGKLVYGVQKNLD